MTGIGLDGWPGRVPGTQKGGGRTPAALRRTCAAGPPHQPTALGGRPVDSSQASSHSDCVATVCARAEQVR
ncbi:hypothetical protein GCM10026982_57170 [Nocardiopsis aegyptia]